MAEFLSKTGFDIAWKKLMRYLRKVNDDFHKSRPNFVGYDPSRQTAGWGQGWGNTNANLSQNSRYPEPIALKVYNSSKDIYEGVYIGNPENMQACNLHRDQNGLLYFDVAEATTIPEIYKNTEPERVTVSQFNNLIESSQLKPGAVYEITYTGPALNKTDTKGKSIKNAGVRIILITTATGPNTFERACRVKTIGGTEGYGDIYADNLICYCSYGSTTFSSESFHIDSMEYKAKNSTILVAYDFINILWWREEVEVNNFYDDQGNSHTAKLLIGSPRKPTAGKKGYWMNTFSQGTGYDAINLAKSTPNQDAFYLPMLGENVGNVNIDGYNLVIYSSSTWTDSLGNFKFNKIDKSNGVTGGWTICGGSMSFDIEVSWTGISNYILGYHCDEDGSYSDGFNCRNNIIKYSQIQFIGNAFHDNAISNSTLLNFRGGLANSTIKNTSSTGCKVSMECCNMDSMIKTISLQGNIDENLMKLGKALPVSDSKFPNAKTNIQNAEIINCQNTISLGSHRAVDCKLEFLGPYTFNNDIYQEYITGYKISSRT